MTNPSGQWFAEEEWDVAVNGNMAADESMERTFTTNVAEQMFIQVVGYEPTAFSVALCMYGVGAKRGEGDPPIAMAKAGNATLNATVNAATSPETIYDGDHLYTNLRGDFTAAYGSATTILLTNLPSWITVTAPKIVAIGVKPNTGEVDYDWIYNRGSGSLEVSYAAGTITVSGAMPLVNTYDFLVVIEGIPRYQGNNIDGTYHIQVRDEAFTVATRSERVEEIDPLDTKYFPDTVADVTNGTDGTYNYYLDMSTHRKGTLQLELGAGTSAAVVKIYGTVQDDGTAAASCTYQDIGSATFGAASWTTGSHILNDNTEKLAGYKYIKVEVVASGGGDDADWTIYAKRLY
jgi:hypothetical protein